jgi:hypothetical protein
MKELLGNFKERKGFILENLCHILVVIGCEKLSSLVDICYINLEKF